MGFHCIDNFFCVIFFKIILEYSISHFSVLFAPGRSYANGVLF